MIITYLGQMIMIRIHILIAMRLARKVGGGGSDPLDNTRARENKMEKQKKRGGAEDFR